MVHLVCLLIILNTLVLDHALILDGLTALQLVKSCDYA